MEIGDFIRLLHPVIAVVVVFPLIGMAVYFAWQTRQRRLETADHGKSRIAIGVGSEHLKVGRWLTSAVVGIALLGIAQPVFKTIIKAQVWSKSPAQVIFIIFLFVATIASLVLLYQAREKHWRAIFATLTGMGVIILGCQDGVYRRTSEWYFSHYYYGIAATMFMIFSLAIVQDIYQDRSNRWRYVHIVLNCVALLFFIVQGMTGARDLLEIPLGWQEPYVYQCDPKTKTCPSPAPPPTQGFLLDRPGKG